MYEWNRWIRLLIGRNFALFFHWNKTNMSNNFDIMMNTSCKQKQIEHWTDCILTALLWFQKIYAGGSGESSITHVKFMVDPLSMYTSGEPIISVDGSGVCFRIKFIFFRVYYLMQLRQYGWKKNTWQQEQNRNPIQIEKNIIETARDPTEYPIHIMSENGFF